MYNILHKLHTALSFINTSTYLVYELAASMSLFFQTAVVQGLYGGAH